MTLTRRVCLFAMSFAFICRFGGDAQAQTTPKIAWDEVTPPTVTGYSVTIDGVRQTYGLTPVGSNGVCGCSIASPVSGGIHTIVVGAYNSVGETTAPPMTVGPVASPGGPYVGTVGTAVAVDGSASKNPVGSIVGYAWKWGDGSSTVSSSSPTASHVYSAAGTFTITLTVTDNAGATASATTTVVVSSITSPTSPTSTASTIVLWTANTTLANVHGNWRRTSDSTAAGQIELWNPDAGAKKIAPALASPTTYFEQTFTAPAGTSYHLWIRLRAESNSSSNDSIHVQFNDSLNTSNSAVYRIGTSSSAEVVLQDGPYGTAPHGWGWSDNGWGALGSNIQFASSGTHTIRIQQREDGAIVDQIVLSPDTYLSGAPGVRHDDATILTYTQGSPVTTSTSVVHAVDVAAAQIHGSWQRLSDSLAYGGVALWNPDAGAAKITPARASPTSYFEATFTAKAGTAYHVWIRMRAQSDSKSNDSVHMQFNDALDANQAPYAGIGTTNSAEFVLQDGSGGQPPHGWGWTDNGWGTLGPNVYFATTGTHTLRIQQREDGAIVDQIVISPDAYLTIAPGATRDDTTILVN